MEITVNGESHQLEKDINLDELLHRLKLTEGRIAVEANGEIVPEKSVYSAADLPSGRDRNSTSNRRRLKQPT